MKARNQNTVGGVDFAAEMLEKRVSTLPFSVLVSKKGKSNSMSYTGVMLSNNWCMNVVMLFFFFYLPLNGIIYCEAFSQMLNKFQRLLLTF